MRNARRALVCAPLLPEFDRESGSRRIYHLLEFLGETGWNISFVAEQPKGEQRYIHQLQQRGVAVYSGAPHEMEELVRVGRFDIAIIAFWYLAEAFIPIIRRASPSTRIVVDTIDLHFVRNARRTFRPDKSDDNGGGPGRLNTTDADEIVRELNTYAAADAIWTVSQKEAGLVADLTNNTQLARVVPDAEDLPPSNVPLAERCGVLFLGNFRHPPNLEGLEFFCRQVLPHLDEAVLQEHPLYIVGNALDDRVRRIANDARNMHLVGWVPSVRPYLERARITVIPVLHGAGTKRKLLQALMVGTPAVSTSIGAEGLGVRHGEHVLIADDPTLFAAAMAKLLRERGLWTRLRRAGQRHIRALHSKDAVRDQLERALAAVLPTSLPTLTSRTKSEGNRREKYQQLVQEVREAVSAHIPKGATALVVSKGDEDLVRFESRRGWHFPQTDAGVYAGTYPGDATAAIEHLEVLRARGAQFLVFPRTALWWLEYYGDFREHLERHYSLILRDDERCVIFGLAAIASRAEASGSSPHIAIDPTLVERGRSPRSRHSKPRSRDVLPARLSALRPPLAIRLAVPSADRDWKPKPASVNR